MSFLSVLLYIVIGGCVVGESNFVYSVDIPENFDTSRLSNEQIPAQIDKQSWFWEGYEFKNGVENREELRITDIEIRRDSNLQQNITNWQHLKHKNELYIVGAINSTLFLYHFDQQNSLLTLRASLSIAEVIKTFITISFSSNNKDSSEIKDSIIVLLSIENDKGIQYLKWFYLKNNQFHSFWIWQLLKKVETLKYFNFDDRHKLLVLYEKSVYFDHSYSLVEVYDINTSDKFSKQLCCQFLVNEVSDIRICPTREGSETFALMEKDHVTLHEYKDILTKCALKPVKNITVLNVSNMMCFESNNIHYFAVSGYVTNFFKLHSTEFFYEEDMETLLNGIGELHFITDLSVDTYRNDVVLLIQLKNLTVLALSWQNEKFQFVRLPNNKLDDFDLASVKIISNYGFISNNTLVKLKVELVALSKPNESGIENLFKTKTILEDALNTQESKISDIKLKKQSMFLKNFKIENLNNFARIDVDNLILNTTNNSNISIESSNTTLEKLHINYEESRALVNELAAEISEIENQLKNTVAISSSDVSFFEKVDVVGNLEITGNAVVTNLFTDYLNNINVDILLNNNLSFHEKITGNKMFTSIKFLEGNLKIECLNGVPVKNIQFDEASSDYTNIDFSKIKKLEVKGNLNLSQINNIDWDILMDQLVFKNQKKVIPGYTKLLGIMNTRFTRAHYLNNFKYPLEYVVKSGPENGDVTGIKTFKTVTVSDLKDVRTINDLDADEFIILTADQSLEHKIIFENLVIDESLQIDGKIIGLPEQYINPDLTLLNSNIIQSNTMFSHLYVSGKVYVQNLIDEIEWTEMDDLILKSDNSTVVTGTKYFPHNVQILGNLEIKSSTINEHPINNFITLDTRQILPSLSKITGNVKFTRVTYEELENLEDKFRINVDDSGIPTCSMKPFNFLKTPIVDEFAFSFINKNITGSEFSSKLEILLSDISFMSLKCRKLIVPKLESSMVNGVNIKDLEDKKLTKNTHQEVPGRVKLSNFETKKLETKFINNRSQEQLKNTARKIESLYREFVDSESFVYLLNVNKFITPSKVNDENLHDLLGLNEISQFLLRTNGSIENLTVKGFVNKINFTDKFSDCVLKNEEFITIKGPKRINHFTTRNLEVQYINSHAVQDIITDTTNQTLVGSLIVKGSAYVSENFNSHGKINDIDSKNINVDVKKLNETVYKFTGDFLTDENINITHLMVAKKIQKKDIDTFLENLIYLEDPKIFISSTKIFDGTVDFKNNITISKNLDNIQLQLFYENAILIDTSAFVNSAVIFSNDILLDKDLAVTDNLKVNTMKGIKINDLIENAVYFNRPTSIMESVTLSNVVFKSDIAVTLWNSTNLDMLLILDKDEVIQDTFICVNANIENLSIRGLINGENLTHIYENTLMISNDQTVKGKISFLNNVLMHGNLSSRYVNDIDISRIISLNIGDPMEGNFVFDNPVVFNNNIQVLGKLNNINISQWQSTTIMRSSSTKSIISGNWTIYGNIDSKTNIRGSGFINNIDMDSVSFTIRKQNEEIEKFISNETENIESICKNLQDQKNRTDNFLHKFKSFEYLRVLQFDKKIESVHYFEYNDTDYILVNFETCHVDIYAYTNENFLLFSNATDFGNMKQYLTFNYKNNIYFVTLGKKQCGRNSGNLWMLLNKQITHIYDFGNVTSIEQSSDISFLLTVNHEVQEWSISNIHRSIFEPVNTRSIVDNKVRFIKNGTAILLVSCDIIYTFQSGVSGVNETRNPFKSIEILSFEAGYNKNEHILLHDDLISSDYIFIYDQNFVLPRELQSIHAYKPNSFTVINFDGLYESLLVFSENKKEIKIYEYKGIEFFKLHSTIQIKVDKLYSFELKTNPYFVKRRCLAIVHDSKLTILEAKMYGEKLNANNQLVCSTT